MNIFGPFISPRFNRAVGINNVPAEICTYSCQYCPRGPTTETPIDRRPFQRPDELVKAVAQKIRAVRLEGKPINYLTFMPDGEPTLDLHLGREIELLEPLGLKIAVITNASLIWQYQVQQDLMLANWVCLKVDTVRESTWRQLNRPHASKYLLPILEGLQLFANTYQRHLVTETTLIKDLNDDAEHVAQLADFLKLLNPHTAYLSVLGPASSPFHPPEEATAKRACQLFSERLPRVEHLSG